ncbi:MAG: pentapeptide repeat-containing protein [Acidimicrobiales bacterium]
MATEKQTGAFWIALLEMPEIAAAIARDMWGWVTALWQRHMAARPILWFLIAYVCVIAAVIGWRYSEDSAFLHWEFWEGVTPQTGNTQDARSLTSGPEGIRNLVWSLATLFGGAAAVVGIILAARRTKAANQQAEAALRQTETAFQSLVTERFTRAVEQLGHEKRAVRLGAIYALERIAKDSARDRDTIVETLAAYIRENAPKKPHDKIGQPLDEAALRVEAVRADMRPPIDIAAALTVLCGLLPTGDSMREKVDLRHTDLRGFDAPGIDLDRARLDQADLYGANLVDANLSGAYLSEANLSVAHLGDANLSGAFLSAANLSRAYLSETNLSGAYLGDANLNGANLGRANLSGAFLADANLSEANLRSTNLSEVSGLSQEQIDGIRYRRNYPPENLPEDLTLPEPYNP